MVVTAQYLCSMELATTWYWNQKPKQYVITVPTHTILHPQLEVNSVTEFHAIPTNVCTGKKAKNSISRKPIYLTDCEYDYILEEVGCRYKIEFEIYVEVYSAY